MLGKSWSALSVVHRPVMNQESAGCSLTHLKRVILTFYQNKALNIVGSPTDLKVTNPSKTEASK